MTPLCSSVCNDKLIPNISKCFTRFAPTHIKGKGKVLGHSASLHGHPWDGVLWDATPPRSTCLCQEPWSPASTGAAAAPQAGQGGEGHYWGVHERSFIRKKICWKSWTEVLCSKGVDLVMCSTGSHASFSIHFPVKVFIGFGFPYEGPAPLEAIANGCIFLQPKFDPPHSSLNHEFFRGKPTSRKVYALHLWSLSTLSID